MAGKIDVNGRKIPDTPIAVDFFRRSHLPSRMLFFLTHAHAGKHKQLTTQVIMQYLN